MVKIRIILDYMKFLYLFFLLIFLIGCEQQPLIDDYKIEGISTGDSLLELMTIDEIEKGKLSSKIAYARKSSNDFFRVVYEKKFEKYDYLSLLAETTDETYIIKGIFGTQYFQDADSCLTTFKNIIIEFSDTYKNTTETNGEKFLGNSSSKFSYHYFDFASGQRIGVQCYFFESGNVELSVSLVPSIELIKWLEEGNSSTSSDS